MLNFSLFTSLHPSLATGLTAFAAVLTAWTPAPHATIGVWPDTFRARQMPVSGGTQYVRVGGQDPAVLLLHGFGDTGDMWVPLAEALVKDHTVIVPDLRGMGFSSHPEGGYEKTGQARDMAAILDELRQYLPRKGMQSDDPVPT
jgi:pimeloyl-ACP methyl ester carboxylesterase